MTTSALAVEHGHTHTFGLAVARRIARQRKGSLIKLGGSLTEVMTMASARARQRRAREEAEQQAERWQFERDDENDDKPPPEREDEPLPIHTTH